jgi:DNA invertase Pin-like site-specific DNA recombinase
MVKYPGIIGYLRVSTKKQGRNGLGIEAQRAAITRFSEAENLPVLAEMVEVETGKGSDALDPSPRPARGPGGGA